MEHAHELPEFLHFLEELIEEYGILRGMRVANSKANLFKQAFSITKSFKTNLLLHLSLTKNCLPDDVKTKLK